MPVSFNPPLDPPNPSPHRADRWLPRLLPGFLYMQDRKYYLYSDKQVRKLKEITKYIFDLAAVPEPGTVSVTVEGIPFSSWDVCGEELHLMGADNDSFVSFAHAIEYDETQYGFLLHGFAFGPSNQVVVEYYTLLWDDTDNEFDSVKVTETFKIKEASRIDYQITQPREVVVPTGLNLSNNSLIAHSGFLPFPPVGGAPVVITDDNYQLTDQRGFQTEFSLDPDTAEITFNTNRNYVQNPAFEITATGAGFPVETYNYPLEWWTTDDLTISEGTGEPFYGTTYRCLDGTGQLIQVIENIDPKEPWTFSLYTQGLATGELCISFLNSTGEYLDDSGSGTSIWYPDISYCTYATGLFPSSTTDWNRTWMTFGQLDSTQCDATGIHAVIPTDAAQVELKINRTLGELCVDAVAAEHAYTPSNFEPLDPNITIEFEGSQRGYWLPNNSGELPLEINVLESNPMRAPVAGGFICAEEFSDIEDYQLGIGELIEGTGIARTGVLHVTGSLGVDVGRMHLPYAKVDGFYKMVPRQKFHLENPAPIDDITDLTIENGTPDPAPDTLEWIPRDGLRTRDGQVELMVLPDSRLTTRLDLVVLDQYQNPAYTYPASIVSASGSIISEENPWTNSYGQITFNYQPPTKTASGDVGQIDTITIVIGGVEETLPVYGFNQTGLDLDSFLG